MNFLHFAVVLFAVSVVLLVGVSLATAPAPLAKLRGLTFATLDPTTYRRANGLQSLFRLHLVSTIALAVFVVGLWVSFA